MAQQVQLTAYVYARQATYEKSPSFSVFGFKDSDTDGHFGSLVAEVPISFEMPDGWNPISVEISCLEAEKRKALEDSQSTVASINERLARLTAITNEVA